MAMFNTECRKWWVVRWFILCVVRGGDSNGYTVCGEGVG
jgi:hypothetical protein